MFQNIRYISSKFSRFNEIFEGMSEKFGIVYFIFGRT